MPDLSGRLDFVSGRAIFIWKRNGMFGKAVKIRHCPATVSAPPRVWFTGKSLKLSGMSNRGDGETESNATGRKPGKAARFGRKSGDRSGCHCLSHVPKGNEGAVCLSFHGLCAALF